MSHLLAASFSPHLLPWLAACSLSGEALATMPCATVPPCQALGPPGQHRLPLCCRRSLLMLMPKYWLCVPPQTSLHLPNIYMPKVQNSSTRKTWTTKSKVQFITSALILRKELANGKGLTPTQQRGRLQGWCGVPKKYPGISKPTGTSYRQIRTVAPCR